MSTTPVCNLQQRSFQNIEKSFNRGINLIFLSVLLFILFRYIFVDVFHLFNLKITCWVIHISRFKFQEFSIFHKLPLVSPYQTITHLRFWWTRLIIDCVTCPLLEEYIFLKSESLNAFFVIKTHNLGFNVMEKFNEHLYCHQVLITENSCILHNFIGQKSCNERILHQKHLSNGSVTNLINFKEEAILRLLRSIGFCSLSEV